MAISAAQHDRLRAGAPGGSDIGPGLHEFRHIPIFQQLDVSRGHQCIRHQPHLRRSRLDSSTIDAQGLPPGLNSAIGAGHGYGRQLAMTVEDLPPEAQVAIGYALPEHRDAFTALLVFDRNLARSVAGASEAIVGQLRLAWWRDALAASTDRLPRGNPLLDELAKGFGEQLPRLGALVDGWETVLLAEAIDGSAIQSLRAGREAGWLALARVLGTGENDAAVRLAAGRWASADLISSFPQQDRELEIIADMQHAPSQPATLPRALRPLVVLDALARRSLAAGGAPLLADRGSAMVALRAGLFGR